MTEILLCVAFVGFVLAVLAVDWWRAEARVRRQLREERLRLAEFRAEQRRAHADAPFTIIINSPDADGFRRSGPPKPPPLPLPQDWR